MIHDLPFETIFETPSFGLALSVRSTPLARRDYWLLHLPGPNCCRKEPEHIINSLQSLSHLGLLLQIAIQLLASISDMLQFNAPTLAVIGMLIPPFNGKRDSTNFTNVSIWYERSIKF